MLGKELGRAEVWVLFARKAPSPPTTSSLTVLDFSAEPGQHTCGSPKPYSLRGNFLSTSICRALLWFLGTQPCPSKSPPQE